MEHRTLLVHICGTLCVRIEFSNHKGENSKFFVSFFLFLVIGRESIEIVVNIIDKCWFSKSSGEGTADEGWMLCFESYIFTTVNHVCCK